MTINIAIDIYDDIVAMFDWHKGEIFGVEIKSESFANFMKQIYMMVWKVSNKEGVL